MVLRFKPEYGNARKTKLGEIIDKQSVASNQEKKKIRSSMYASDYGQCLKRCYFQFFPDEYPADSDIDARTARIFSNGDAVHERLGGYLKREESLDFHDEVTVPRDDLDVHGRCDGILVLDGAALVVEFKSINKDDVVESKPEHIGQLTFYLGMFRQLRKDLKEDFGFVEDEQLDEDDLQTTSLSGRTFETLTHVEKWLLLTQGEIRGELIYESKSTNEVFAFPVDFDQTRFDEIRNWFTQLKWHVENKEIPNVKYYPSKFPCSWGRGKCSYWETCHGQKCNKL